MGLTRNAVETSLKRRCGLRTATMTETVCVHFSNSSAESIARARTGQRASVDNFSPNCSCTAEHIVDANLLHTSIVVGASVEISVTFDAPSSTM